MEGEKKVHRKAKIARFFGEKESSEIEKNYRIHNEIQRRKRKYDDVRESLWEREKTARVLHEKKVRDTQETTEKWKEVWDT